MLSSVIKGASLSLYEDIEINFDNNARLHEHYSNKQYDCTTNSWPCSYLELDLPDTNLENPDMIIAKRGLAIFPNIDTAIENFLELK